MATLRMKDFQPGIPVALAMKSLETKDAPDNGYGPAVIFSTSEGAMYLAPAAARQIQDEFQTLAIQPGDPIKIVRKGHRLEVLREIARPSAEAVHPYPPPPLPAAAYASPMALRMSSCFMAAVDAVSEAQTYADRKGLKVTFTSEDVRSVAISCYIQCGKEGR